MIEKHAEINKNYGHYYKEWFGKIDIYRLTDLFEVKRKPIDHAVKKLLCAGKRGAKDEIKDYREAIDSINRAIEMIEEDLERDERAVMNEGQRGAVKKVVIGG